MSFDSDNGQDKTGFGASRPEPRDGDPSVPRIGISRTTSEYLQRLEARIQDFHEKLAAFDAAERLEPLPGGVPVRPPLSGFSGPAMAAAAAAAADGPPNPASVAPSADGVADGSRTPGAPNLRQVQPGERRPPARLPVSDRAEPVERSDRFEPGERSEPTERPQPSPLLRGLGATGPAPASEPVARAADPSLTAPDRVDRPDRGFSSFDRPPRMDPRPTPGLDRPPAVPGRGFGAGAGVGVDHGAGLPGRDSQQRADEVLVEARRQAEEIRRHAAADADATRAAAEATAADLRSLAQRDAAGIRAQASDDARVAALRTEQERGHAEGEIRQMWQSFERDAEAIQDEVQRRLDRLTVTMDDVRRDAARLHSAATAEADRTRAEAAAAAERVISDAEAESRRLIHAAQAAATTVRDSAIAAVRETAEREAAEARHHLAQQIREAAIMAIKLVERGGPQALEVLAGPDGLGGLIDPK